MTESDERKSNEISVRALQHWGIPTAAGPWATARATGDTAVLISGLGERWRPRSGQIYSAGEVPPDRR